MLPILAKCTHLYLRLSIQPSLSRLLVSSASTPSPSLVSLRFASSEAKKSKAKRAKTSPEMQPRDVAGSFIFRLAKDSPDGVTQVALFRRSAEVRTYQHKWAPISGTVEASDADPLATAWRELAEETGLTPESLRYLHRGKPYSFADASVGRHWTINPFAFVLEPGAASSIRLDWEHEAYDWFNPLDLAADKRFPGVPRLMDSLRRVWFELDFGPDTAAALERGIRTLRVYNDGANADKGEGPVLTALRVMTDVIATLENTNPACWWRNFRFAAWHLVYNGMQPMNMGVLIALSNFLMAVRGNVLVVQKVTPDVTQSIYYEAYKYAQGHYGLDGVVNEEVVLAEYDANRVDILKQKPEQEIPLDSEAEDEDDEMGKEELDQLIIQSKTNRFFSDL